MKKISNLLIMTLCGCFCLSAQQQSLFYYYKGNPLPLNVNNQHFLLYANVNKISVDDLEQTYKITEWLKDGSNGIIEVQVNIQNNNYDSVISDLKTKEYIIDIEPVIENGELFNTSRYFM